jgi:predicted ATP-dependent serine protease
MSTARSKLAEVPWWKRIPLLSDVQHEPVEWLVKDLIPLQTLVLLVGKPGSYKSWLSMDLARAVSRGEAFAQMPTGPARHVLYVDFENAKNVIAKRKDRLKIADTPRLLYWGRWCSLPFPKQIGTSKELAEFIAETQPLIIFDSLVRFHRVDENDNSQMARVMNNFLGLSRKGATVVLVHHAGKEKEKMFRGASEIEAAVDVACRIDREGQGRLIRIRQFKNRIAEERTFELMWTEFGFESITRQRNERI